MTDTEIPNPPAVPEDRRPMDHRQQPKKKDRGPIPARQGNGYYADHTSGDRLRSVTTIINGGVPKEALIFWAAKTVAEAAVEATPQLVAALRRPDELAELTAWIKRAHTRKKDERADVGSAVHTIIEKRILGEPMPLTITMGTGDDAEEVPLDGPKLGPYVEAFLAFEREWEVRFTASEMVVANPDDGWAGTLDYMIEDGPIAEALRAAGYPVPAGVDLMGDTKTGGTLRKILTYSGHLHGVYPEAGLQMSAYRRAEVCWLRSGDRVPMPPTADVGIILHLSADEDGQVGYDIVPAWCGDDVYRYFRYAQMVDEWSSRLASAKADRPIIGTALTHPTGA